MVKIVDHSPQLGNRFEKVYTEGSYSDVTLLVDDKQFPVHRLILAAQSDFFRVLFYENQMMEATQKEMTIEASPMAFERILRYLYSGKIDLDQDCLDLLEVLELSHRYNLLALEEVIVENVVGVMNSENVALVINTGQLLDSKKLIEKCCQVINEDWGSFLVAQTFLLLDGHSIVQIFSHKFFKLINFRKFEAICAWLQANPDCSPAVKQQMLAAIELAKLSNKQLTSIVRPTQLFDDSTLMDIISPRKDVPKEIVPMAVTPSKVIKTTGGPGGSRIIDKAVVVKACIHNSNEFEIIVDLTPLLVPFQFNCIEFNVGNELIEELWVYHRVSENTCWNAFRSHKKCRRLQTIFVPMNESKFLKITGTPSVTDFIVSRVTTLPNLKKNYLSPQQNILTVSTAFIENGSSQSALCWDGVERGVGTPFTESPCMIIRCNQPYFLSQFRFRLWDFDGRTQNVLFVTYQKDSPPRIEKKFHRLQGWQTVDLPPDVYSKFLIRGAPRYTPLSKVYTKVRLVHVEASNPMPI